MPITFSNTIYGPGRWGVVYLFQNQGTVDFVCQDRIVFNGTVTRAGDTVTALYNDASYTFTVTSYDNPGALVLRFGTNYYVISNTDLSQGQILPFNLSGPSSYSAPPCFVEGTRVLTRRGEVPVEELRPGDDLVAVLAGQLLPIVWIGRRTVDCTAEENPADMWPFRVRAHAFGPGRPHRDLYLSPDHAIHVDGMLIPVRYLENGATILRERRDRVTYFHVELARHDIVLSEGLGSESYLDTGNRDDFVRLRREPGDTPELAESAARQIWAERGCLPLVADGPALRTVRTKLAARAAALGHAATDDTGLVLHAGGRDHHGRFDGEAWHFTLDRMHEGARLISTAFVPSVMSTATDDRRVLGVPVTRLMTDGRMVPLHDPRLGRGWHRPEHDLRWTAGAAELPPLQSLSVVLAPIGRTALHPRLATPAAAKAASHPVARLERGGGFGHTSRVRITPGGRERPWGANLPFVPPPKAQPAPGNAQASRTARRHEPLESRPAAWAAPTE